MLSWEIQVWQNKGNLTAFPSPQLLTTHLGQASEQRFVKLLPGIPAGM